MTNSILRESTTLCITAVWCIFRYCPVQKNNLTDAYSFRAAKGEKTLNAGECGKDVTFFKADKIINLIL